MCGTTIHAGPISLGGIECQVVSHDAVLTTKKKSATLTVTLELHAPEFQFKNQTISITASERFEGKKGKAKAKRLFETFKQGVVVTTAA